MVQNKVCRIRENWNPEKDTFKMKELSVLFLKVATQTKYDLFAFYFVLFFLDLPGPGSDGSRPTILWGLTPGLLIMSCWLQGVLGCAQDEGFVMLDTVCKLIKLAVSFFVMQKER